MNHDHRSSDGSLTIAVGVKAALLGGIIGLIVVMAGRVHMAPAAFYPTSARSAVIDANEAATMAGSDAATMGRPDAQAATVDTGAGSRAPRLYPEPSANAVSDEGDTRRRSDRFKTILAVRGERWSR